LACSELTTGEGINKIKYSKLQAIATIYLAYSELATGGLEACPQIKNLNTISAFYEADVNFYLVCIVSVVFYIGPTSTVQ